MSTSTRMASAAALLVACALLSGAPAYAWPSDPGAHAASCEGEGGRCGHARQPSQPVAQFHEHARAHGAGMRSERVRGR